MAFVSRFNRSEWRVRETAFGPPELLCDRDLRRRIVDERWWHEEQYFSERWRAAEYRTREWPNATVSSQLRHMPIGRRKNAGHCWEAPTTDRRNQPLRQLLMRTELQQVGEERIDVPVAEEQRNQVSNEGPEREPPTETKKPDAAADEEKAAEELDAEIWNGEEGFHIRIRAKGFEAADLQIFIDSSSNVLGVDALHEHNTREGMSVRRQLTRRYQVADDVELRSVRAQLCSDGHLEIVGDKKRGGAQEEGGGGGMGQQPNTEKAPEMMYFQ